MVTQEAGNMNHPSRTTMSRRAFGQGSAAAVLSVLAKPGRDTLLAAGAQARSGWIDAHVHVWTNDVQGYPIDKGFQVSDMQPRRFTPEDLFQHTRPVGVDRVVLIQMSFYRFDNSYMLDAMQRFPQVFSGIGMVDYQSPDLEADIRSLAQRGVRGFRIATLGDRTSSWLGDHGMERLWKTAAREKLAVCPLINPADLPIVDQLCERHPETSVVVDHFARVGIGGVKAEQLDGLCRLARHGRVHVKTSAFYAVGGPSPYDGAIPMLRRVIDAFGPHRLMWASDCPYQVQPPHAYEPAIAIVRDKLEGLSDADRAWILRGTAEKLFFS
jgi:predicted TIM-barrel fold metal-dependent hydrolase